MAVESGSVNRSDRLAPRARRLSVIAYEEMP